MFDGMAVYVVTMVVMVAIASAILLGLLLYRRPWDQWKEHWREQMTTPAADAPAQIQRREERMSALLNDPSARGKGYITPEHLPGYGSIEAATERLEDITARRSLPPEESPRS